MTPAPSTKRSNRNRTYRFLYEKGVATRPEAASALGLSLPTVSQYVQELQDAGLVEECGILESTGGRKPMALRCRGDARVAIGLSLTPQSISGVVINLLGDTLLSKKEALPFSQSPDYLQSIAALTQALAQEADASPQTLLGIAVAVPGIVDPAGDHITFSHVFPTGFSREYLAAALPFPCRLCNDANAAGFAEQWNSAQTGVTAYLSLNNTLGGAILANHTIYPGTNHRAAEFGHLSISRDGPRCSCGQRGCLGCYCAATVLSGDFGEDLDAFFAALAEGNSHAKVLWQEYLSYLSTGIAAIRAILDCDVILGGDVGAQIAPYLPELQLLVQEKSPFGDDGTFLKPCRHRHMASSVGAALHLIDEFLNTI